MSSKSKGVEKLVQYGDEKYADDIRFSVFDIETEKEVSDVGGWDNKEAMGVAVLSEYDSKEGLRSYPKDECEKFIDKLSEVDLLIGHNIIDFDYNVLQGIGMDKEKLTEPKCLDIFSYIRKKTGEWIGLDDLVKKNLGVSKMMDGSEAPKLWKEGEKGKVVDYCEDDVYLTKALYYFGKYHGFLLLPDDVQEDGKISIKTNW